MIELRAGRLRCELDPEHGGAVAGLWRDGTPLLQAEGCRPLVPYANALGHATVEWRGTQEPLVRQGDAPDALHGVAWARPWSVLEADETSAMLAFEHRASASWPYAFDCSHTLRLRASGLELTLGLTNQATQPAPASVAWRIALAAVAGGDAADAQGGEGWGGVLQLRGGSVPLALRSTLRHLALVRHDEGLVLVPASHAPNAVQLHAAAGPGLVLLQPGESLLAQASLEVEERA